jgi:hypothetical protein
VGERSSADKNAHKKPHNVFRNAYGENNAVLNDNHKAENNGNDYATNKPQLQLELERLYFAYGDTRG